MKPAGAALLLALVLPAVPGWALAGPVDITASYDGSLTITRPKQAAPVAGTLRQTGRTFAGTLTVLVDHASLAGEYAVSGRIRGKQLALKGQTASGATIRWTGRVVPSRTIRGRAILRKPGARRRGRLVIAPRADAVPVCDSAFFTTQVMSAVLHPICANCHVPGGAAQDTSFRVTANDPLATQRSVAPHIDRTRPEQSAILRKPTGQVAHGGGQQLQPGGAPLGVLQQWVQLVASGHQCDPGGPDVTLVPLRPTDVLLRAAMDLTGHRPALDELDAVERDASTYGSIIDRYLRSPELLERVKEVYDDALLVRREDYRDEGKEQTAAIYDEAVELVAYIVAHDRPFTEIGTADYTVANEAFQRDPNRLPFPMDPVSGPAWQPTHYRDGRPHAGLLSTSAFYQVWDTNDTNKNRRRANRWSIVFHCYNFLDTPVDVTRNVDNNDEEAVLNAVTTRPDCRACHDRLDPMASFLFPMDNVYFDEDFSGYPNPPGFFSGDPERWREANRRPPAVDGAGGRDIRDMGRLLVEHPRFADCQTRRAFKMLFLREPKTNAELGTVTRIAYEWSTEDHYDFRKLVRRWLLADVYRGRPANADPTWVRRVSPERLERLVTDLTGFVWSRPPERDEPRLPPRTSPVPLLTTDDRGFRVILGGINGLDVKARSFGLNASVGVLQRKLAALAADYVVRTDLARPDGARVLLGGVTGAEDPIGDEATTRAAIARIARRLDARRHAPDDALVSAWFDLYRELHADSSEGGTDDDQVPGTPGERAWRGLLVAMLRSPRLLLY